MNTASWGKNLYSFKTCFAAAALLLGLSLSAHPAHASSVASDCVTAAALEAYAAVARSIISEIEDSMISVYQVRSSSKGLCKVGSPCPSEVDIYYRTSSMQKVETLEIWTLSNERSSLPATRPTVKRCMASTDIDSLE
jgi:hypothetical protein